MIIDLLQKEIITKAQGLFQSKLIWSQNRYGPLTNKKKSWANPPRKPQEIRQGDCICNSKANFLLLIIAQLLLKKAGVYSCTTQFGEPNDETNWGNIGKKKRKKKCLISYVSLFLKLSFWLISAMQGKLFKQSQFLLTSCTWKLFN